MKMDFETVRALQKATGTRMLKVHDFDPLKRPKQGRVYRHDDIVFIAVEGDVVLTLHPSHVEQLVTEGVLPSSCLSSLKRH